MDGLKLLSPENWVDYELIDSGGFEKLERFGINVLSRPEPQAIWDKSMSGKEWSDMANASFGREARSEEKGEWSIKPGTKEQWWIGYRLEQQDINMRLGLTSFKHVGLFPEQAVNWDFIATNVSHLASKTKRPPQILNLFAYTGGASLAAAAAGAEVTHVDSVKQVVSWARENAERSRLDGIRWIVDDALKFVRREVKRGKKYDGIILDPPAYGRGPDGEKWVLEQNIGELLALCAQLLEDRDSFMVFNLYSMGLSALLAKTVVNQKFGDCGQEQLGELFLEDRFGKKLPLGVYYRFVR